QFTKGVKGLEQGHPLIEEKVLLPALFYVTSIKRSVPFGGDVASESRSPSCGRNADAGCRAAGGTHGLGTKVWARIRAGGAWGWDVSHRVLCVALYRRLAAALRAIHLDRGAVGHRLE